MSLVEKGETLLDIVLPMVSDIQLIHTDLIKRLRVILDQALLLER